MNRLDRGVLRDITDYTAANGCAAQHAEGGLAAYSVDGKLYGLPMYASNVALYYNKNLAEKAGIDPTQIKTWDDFLDQVKAAKDAGETPILLGGKDKWPAMFYHAMLAGRILPDGSYAGAGTEDGGYASEGWVKVASELKRLGDLEPFQAGYLDTTYDKSQTLFGDGAGIFMLMGEWLVPAQKSVATDGKGLADEEIGIVSFPAVAGGKGNPKATYGGMNGLLVSANAPDLAVDFLCDYLGTENQTKAAKMGLWLPVAKGAGDAIENDLNKWAATRLGESGGHTVFDQGMPAAVHGVQLDVVVDLISGGTDPDSAQQLLEEERQLQ